MGEVVIIGAGIAGLSAALLLGRQGRKVILCERDPAPVPDTPEEMWTDWPRPSLPQARLGHGFTPLFHRLLRERAPDLLERLWAAGAQPWDIAAMTRLPADPDMVTIMCRRHVLEGLLRQAVTAEPSVELRTGCAVAGLLAEPSTHADVPKVVGVRIRDGSAIAAESVILAGGRHVPMAAWLRAIGAAEPEEVSEGCGQLWFTRYYRVQPGPREDETITRQLTVIAELGYMMFSIAGADRGTFCVELGVPTADQPLHAVHEQAVFLAAVQSIPMVGPWIAPDRATPIGSLAAMGQERNLLRRFVREGCPLALGLHVIGDARCRTNSDYAWGAAIALTEAVTLVDLLTEQRDDPLAQALAFEECLGEDIAGWYHLSVERDRARLRLYRGEPVWDTADADPMERFLQTVVIPAAEEDVAIRQAVTRQWTQLDPPGSLARNTVVQERARALVAERPLPAEPPPAGPTREELLQIIAAARHRAARQTVHD